VTENFEGGLRENFRLDILVISRAFKEDSVRTETITINGREYVLYSALSGEQVLLPLDTREYWWGRDFWDAQDAINFADGIRCH